MDRDGPPRRRSRPGPGSSLRTSTTSASRPTRPCRMSWRATREVAEQTEGAIAAVIDLDQAVPVPQGVPWFPADVEAWSVRWGPAPPRRGDGPPCRPRRHHPGDDRRGPDVRADGGGRGLAGQRLAQGLEACVAAARWWTPGGAGTTAAVVAAPSARGDGAPDGPRPTTSGTGGPEEFPFRVRDHVLERERHAATFDKVRCPCLPGQAQGGRR